jgi:hypothetical protein
MKTALTGLAFGIGLVLFPGCTSKPSNQDLSGDQLVQRGEYIVTTLGCSDCHSPKRMGERGPEVIPELNLSGYPADRPLTQIDTPVLRKGWILFQPDLTAAVGPWGVSFAGNITSDATGIGNWTEENFIRAMKEGKFKGLEGARSLLPPMPWQNYGKMNEADLRAIFAYLKTTKPVHNVVPAMIPPDEIR